MNVFIIATTHQTIQLVKAYEQFKMKPDETIVIHMNSDGKELEVGNLPGIPIKEFSNWTFKDTYSFPQKHRQYISYLRLMKNKYSSFVVYASQYSSDYTLLANSILSPEVFYLMDEGTASFSVVEKRRKVATSFFRRLVKSLVYRCYISYPKSIRYYTQYKLRVHKPDSVVPYDFTKITKKTEIEKTKAIVLGTTLVEMKLMSNDSYMDILFKLDSFFRSNNIGLIEYYAHRKEDASKLSHINLLGWTIVNSSIPFETRFSQMASTPKMIVSFLSPILDTISKQYLHTPDLYIISPLNKMRNVKNLTVYQSIQDAFMENPKLKFLYF